MAKASRKKRTRRTRVPRRNNPPVGTVLAFVALGALAAGGAWYYFSKPKAEATGARKTKKGRSLVNQDDIEGTFRAAMQAPLTIQQSEAQSGAMQSGTMEGYRAAIRARRAEREAAAGASAPEGTSAPGALPDPTAGTRAP